MFGAYEEPARPYTSSAQAESISLLAGTTTALLVAAHRAGDWGDVPRSTERQNGRSYRAGTGVMVSRFLLVIDVWVTTDQTGETHVLALPPMDDEQRDDYEHYGDTGRDARFLVPGATFGPTLVIDDHLLALPQHLN